MTPYHIIGRRTIQECGGVRHASFDARQWLKWPRPPVPGLSLAIDTGLVVLLGFALGRLLSVL